MLKPFRCQLQAVSYEPIARLVEIKDEDGVLPPELLPATARRFGDKRPREARPSEEVWLPALGRETLTLHNVIR